MFYPNRVLLFTFSDIVLVKPLGWYITKVFNGESFFLRRPVEKMEFLLYRAAGVKTTVEQHWIRYAGSFLLFHFIGFLFLYTVLRLQAYLPLNPSKLPNVSADLSLNTAISFLTNTNWQNYCPEAPVETKQGIDIGQEETGVFKIPQ